jgi:hypothetical protein
MGTDLAFSGYPAMGRGTKIGTKIANNSAPHFSKEFVNIDFHGRHFTIPPRTSGVGGVKLFLIEKATKIGA